MPRHGDIVTKSGDGALSVATLRVHNAVREWVPNGAALAVLIGAGNGDSRKEAGMPELARFRRTAGHLDRHRRPRLLIVIALQEDPSQPSRKPPGAQPLAKEPSATVQTDR